MKKPKPRHRRGSTKGNTAQRRAHGVPSVARRRKVTRAGFAGAAALLVGGALASEAWTDIRASDPHHRNAYRTFSYEVLGYDFSARSENQPPAMTEESRSSQLSNQATVQISEENQDLGAMAVSEERSAEFFLRNVGGEPLEIPQVQTSCMCTFAHVIVDDEQSPAFNMEMHNAPAIQFWKGVVEPGLTATVRVIYRPSLMPVQGPVTRSVKFNTNDPARPIVELSIHANVQ